MRAPSQLVFIPYVNGVNAGLREAYCSCYDKYAAVRTAIWPSCVSTFSSRAGLKKQEEEKKRRKFVANII